MDIDDSSTSAPVVRNDLRAALQFAVTQVCVEEDASSETKMSPGAVLALSELLYLYVTTCLSQDIAAFCAHAGRKTINESDVLLVARKNPEIRKKLQAFCEQFTTSINESSTATVRRSTSVKAKSKAAPSIPYFSPDTAPAARSPVETSDDSSSDSSEDEAKSRGRLATRLPPVAQGEALASSDDDDDDDSKELSSKPEPPAREPPKRFRLPQAENSDDDDDEDGGWLSSSHCPPQRKPSEAVVAPSRVQELLETMSQDST